MEFLDIVDDKGLPTGKTVERTIAHSEGIPHRTSHVWILRRKEGSVEILLQKRSDNKDSHPGYYDISSAGHIPAGSDYIPSALRELKEELGVEAAAEELTYCGQRHFESHNVFYGKPFIDNQYSNVYVMWLDRNPEDFILQESEVSLVKWYDFEECIKAVLDKSIPTCINEEELLMIKRTIM